MRDAVHAGERRQRESVARHQRARGRENAESDGGVGEAHADAPFQRLADQFAIADRQPTGSPV